MTQMENSDSFWIRNDYASIEISIDRNANGPRFRIRDHIRETERFVDPLQMECFIRIGMEELDNVLPI